MHHTSVGNLRSQCAFKDSAEPVLIVSPDKTLPPLRVVGCYPDTTDGGSFKIEVVRVEVAKN